MHKMEQSDPVDEMKVVKGGELHPDAGLVDPIDEKALQRFLKMAKPFNAHENFLDVIKHFTPTWFAMIMGTGIAAICLNTLSQWLPSLNDVATGIWVFNILLFIAFSLMLTAKTCLFPSSWLRLLKHPVQPMFLGCIPMGLITIVNGFILFGLPLIGNLAINFAHVLWWIDVALSIASVLVVPYFMFTRQDQSLTNMTAVWLLPFVASEVAASSGGMLLPHLNVGEALDVMVLSFALWSVSVSLAMSILVIFFQRLVMHKLPSVDVAASIWLPLGPTGTGALALLLLGNGAENLVLSQVPPHLLGMLNLLPGFGLLGGIIIWALATWWFVIALLVTLYYVITQRHALKFNMGFWAYTFPLGVYTMATENLGRQTDMHFFIGLGALLAVSLFVIWLAVCWRTIKGGYQGHLIKDPTVN